MIEKTTPTVAPSAAAISTAGAKGGAKLPRWQFAALMLVVRQNLLPIVVAAATVIVFGRLGQVREVLFGTIGLVPNASAGSVSPLDYIGPQFWALLATIGMLATALWYASRLLLTVDSATTSRLARIAVRRRASGVVEEFPRLLGAASAAGLIVTQLTAQSASNVPDLLAMLVGLVLTLGPVATVVRILQHRLSKKQLGAWLTGTAGGWFIVACLLIRLARPADRDWSASLLLSMACLLPALFYLLVAWRRPLLRRIARRFNLTPRAPDAGMRFTLRDAIVRLLGLGAVGGAIVLLLALGPLGAARLLGSAAIALLAVNAVLCLLCAATLLLRHLDYKHPGAVIAMLAGLLALYLVLHIALGWRPFRERIGDEYLPSVSAIPAGDAVPSAPTRDIVVNAYGGGLRAALFTALSLAELDDRSCGEFGRRLERMSGVSGGSLGIAVYLLLRQEYIATGGWVDCTPGDRNNPLELTQQVEQVLLQDHLSAALARMFSVDLITPLKPARGQALLESWQDAIERRDRKQRAASSGSGDKHAGLALPLHALNGGLDPGPEVYFNTTQVQSGRTLWMSNRNQSGDASGTKALPAQFQVGQAVLHSARFPVISPAGSMARDGSAPTLVDGGYADNSGAATLLAKDSRRAGRFWLNIDGNSPSDTCVGSGDTKAEGVFSGLDALLAVRRSQADLAVERFAHDSNSTPIPLVLNLEEGFKKTILDPDERCARVRQLRSAPLGWYLTPVTAGDQRLARLAAVNQVCQTLKPLCGQ